MELTEAVETPLLTRDVVAIGASAGGIQALELLLAGLPASLPAAVCVVLHLAPDSPGLLPAILQRRAALPVISPADGAALEHSHVYVAPPDRHLLLEGPALRVVRGPKENRHRPSIDVLFRSAAASFGPRVMGILLTGRLNDGASGLWTIKSSGGVAVVQDPQEAELPDMPLAALQLLDVDWRLPLPEIARLIVRLAGSPTNLPDLVRHEAQSVPGHAEERPLTAAEADLGAPAGGSISPFTCPDCGGSLWELHEGDHLRYRCHVGHSFSEASLLSSEDNNVEEALYAALRALKQRAALIRRLGERFGPARSPVGATYEEEAQEMDRQAEVLQRLLTGEAVC